jgi:superfamily II DNA helicase RecQ
VQRTGWGKSAVYFVATALLRALGSGPTVIVSPLHALMRNQIAAARRACGRSRNSRCLRSRISAGGGSVVLFYSLSSFAAEAARPGRLIGR